MSVLTRRGGGSWMAVSNAGYYGSVVSNYAAALQQAQEQQDNTELENKVFAYRQGQLPFSELSDFLNTKLSVAIPKSQKELELKQLIAALNTENTNKERDLERIKLEQKYVKDGISATERVEIENQLLKFFKEGTVEYAEQKQNIANAVELERQDKNNRRIADLTARLAGGGISTSETLDILEEQRSLVEPGSEDQMEIDKNIELTKVKLEEEEAQEEARQKEEEAMQLYSDLLDQYLGDDGELTNEDELAINMRMQELYEPGTKEYIDLKKQEATLRNALAEDARSGGSGGAEQGAKSVEAQILAADSELEKQFKEGAITGEEYIDMKAQIFDALGELYNTNPKIASPENLQSLEENKLELPRLKEGLSSGKYLTVIKQKGEGAGQQQIVPNDPTTLMNFAEESFEVPETYIDEKGNVQIKYRWTMIDEDGNEVEVDEGTKGAKKKVVYKTEATPVISVKDDQGQVVQTRFNDRGQLEIMSQMSTPGGNVLNPTGQVLGAQAKRLEGGMSKKPETKLEGGGMSVAPSKYDNSPLGKLLSAATEGRMSIAPNKLNKLQKEYDQGRKSVPEGMESSVGISKEQNKQVQAYEASNTGFNKLFTNLPGGEDTKQALKIAGDFLSKTPVEKGFSIGGSVLENIYGNSAVKSLVDKTLSKVGGKPSTKKPGEFEFNVSEKLENLTGLKPIGQGKDLGPVTLPDYGFTENPIGTIGKIATNVGSKIKDSATSLWDKLFGKK